MKRILFIAILSILGSIALQSCDEPKSLSGLKTPIRVLGVAKETDDKYGSILLIDSVGMTRAFSSQYATGNALIETYKVGDTIK